MAYATIDKGESHFNAVTTTGTGSSQAITGVGFQPDWIWGKRRDDTGHPTMFDVVRGVTKGLETSGTGAEFTSTDYYSSFDSDGFTIAAGASGAGNGSSQTAVQWCWKAGATASANGNGSISSSVSANTTAGFSIVSYTGNGTLGATVGHGLGSAPSMVIVKRRDTTGNWWTYHSKLGGADKYIVLNSTSGVGTSTNIWNNTAPTSTVFSLGDNSSYPEVNGTSNTFIAYCFAEKKGYSKFFQYEGNANSDGTFVYLGFAPAWVMVKPIDAADNWVMFDNTRHNAINSSTAPYQFYANKNFAETTDTKQLDFLSNGFKVRNSGNTINRSSTFIGMAFAEHPFVSSTGTPITAR